MGLSRQEYWSELPFPSPGDLPNPGIEPGTPALQADALTSEPPGKPIGRITGRENQSGASDLRYRQREAWETEGLSFVKG